MKRGNCGYVGINSKLDTKTCTNHDLFLLICISDFVLYARSLFRSFDYKRLAKEYSDESTCKYG